ncbi:Uncharacterised protein [Xylophilus ampelinus]|nr:Uncharacterised protein [Xylophilus ampelinus]
MSTKQILIVSYAGCGLLMLMYQWIFVSGVGFAAALGKALVWPAVLFPALGGFIGAVLLIAILVAIYFV